MSDTIVPFDHHMALIDAALAGLDDTPPLRQFLIDHHDLLPIASADGPAGMVPAFIMQLATGGDPVGTVEQQVASILEGYQIGGYPELPDVLTRLAKAHDPAHPETGKVADFLAAIGARAVAEMARRPWGQRPA